MLDGATDFEAGIVRMTDAEANSILRGASSIFPPVVLAVVAALVLYFAADYGATARRLPVLIGAITLALAFLDLVSRLPGTPGRVLRLSLGAGFREREMDFDPGWRAELAQLVWLAAVVGAVVAAGLLVAISLFVFFYCWLRGRWSLWLSALTAGMVVSLVALVCDFVLDYELYRGLLFADDAWL